MNKRIQIGVIGSAGPEEYAFDKPVADMYRAAEEIGKLLAEQNAIVINGGKGGVMEAVSKGAKNSGGLVAAEVAGLGRGESNAFVDIEIITGDVAFRGPSQLIAMSDAVIAIGGGAGTLQELCVAYRMAKPTVLLTGFGGWTDKLAMIDYLDERKTIKMTVCNTPAEAVNSALEYAKMTIRRK